MQTFEHNSCFGCEERHMNCHSTCEKGLAQEEVFRQIREAREAERELAGYYSQQQRVSDRSKWEMKRNGVR